MELEKLKNIVPSLQSQLKNQSETIKNLQARIRCFETMKKQEEDEKNKKRKEVISCNFKIILRSPHLNYFIIYYILQEYDLDEILHCLKFGRSTKHYPPSIRLFCLTLHFYSPRAYEYLRQKFNLNVPSIRTLRYWYSSINGSPGFTNEAFDALRQRCEIMKAEHKNLLVAVMYDEMSIRKHSQYDASTKEYLGHISIGKSSEDEYSTPLCKEAFVVMVSTVGDENAFKLPIGYFFCAGLSADEKAAIVTEAIYRLHRIGIKVVSLVFDGPPTNIATAKKLGANFGKDQPYFVNPFDENNVIYIILDPPHMIKLSRNCLGNKEIIYHQDGDEISWKFIEDLYELQKSQNIDLGNKLTKTHIEYRSNKMNVRLAAQTISNSVATSIDYLNTNLKMDGFFNSAPTSKYLRTFKNIFNVMNSKPGHTDTKFKRPISPSTVDEFSAFFQEAKKYIKGLMLFEDGKKKPILKTKSHTPYFGFHHNTTSFLGIYHDYIIPNGYNRFFTFNVSQDHLETFFGAIRSMGG